MTSEPISKFSTTELVEMCKKLDAFSEKQKEYLDNENVKAIIKQRKAKLPETFAFVNFIPIIKRVLNAQIQLESAQSKDVIILAIRDRITRKFIRTQDAKELRKKKIYAFCPDDMQFYELEHWNNRLNDVIVLEPFMKGKITYIEEHFKLPSGFEGHNMEIKDFQLDRLLTSSEISELIEKYELAKNVIDFSEKDMFQFVIVKARIKGIWRIRKTFWNPATEKLEPKEEYFEFLEPSLRTDTNELCPVMRFGLETEGDIAAIASAEFRTTKFGINHNTLTDFNALLQANVDSQDTELRQIINDVYGHKNCYFMGLLRKYDPNYISTKNEIMTIFTLDIGTIIESNEDFAPKVETETAQTTLSNNTTFGALLPTNEFIKKQYDELSAYIDNPTTLRQAISDKVTKEYGVQELSRIEVITYLDELCGKVEG